MNHLIFENKKTIWKIIPLNFGNFNPCKKFIKTSTNKENKDALDSFELRLKICCIFSTKSENFIFSQYVFVNNPVLLFLLISLRPINL